jgi:hypothetical protein
MPYTGNKPSAVPLTSADIADGIITSAKIVDGTIVNADINASAGLVLTKLASTGTLTLDNIQFPATQVASANANNLDDYEEGTFTPAWAFSTSGSVAYASQSGKYTKIGNVVYFDLLVQTSSISSPSGDATLTGLPFTSRSTNPGGSFITYKRRWNTDMPNLVINVATSGTFMYFLKNATNAEESLLKGTDFSTAATTSNSFILTGVYFV